MHHHIFSPHSSSSFFSGSQPAFLAGSLTFPFSLTLPPSLVCKEHQFPLAPLSPVTLIPLAVRLPFPLSIPWQASGRGLALRSTWRGRHRRQVMLQQGGMKGHGGHWAPNAAWVLAVTVGVVELLLFCWAEKTGSDMYSENGAWLHSTFFSADTLVWRLFWGNLAGKIQESVLKLGTESKQQLKATLCDFSTLKWWINHFYN